jgi:PLP dependent protein
MLFEKSKLNLSKINDKISNTCQRVGRSLDSISLLAVSKNQNQQEIIKLLEAGHRMFGENRVQEAESKWPPLRSLYSDLQLHLIGPLQTNKVAAALELFDVIETIDRPRLVLALAKEWQNTKRRTHKLLIQVNTGHEPQKSGVIPEELAALIDLCHANQLPITGLMCIPPLEEDPTPHFQELNELGKRYNLFELSMGMSRDYPLAIAYGATEVRIGTALWQS